MFPSIRLPPSRTGAVWAPLPFDWSAAAEHRVNTEQNQFTHLEERSPLHCRIRTAAWTRLDVGRKGAEGRPWEALLRGAAAPMVAPALCALPKSSPCSVLRDTRRQRDRAAFKVAGSGTGAIRWIGGQTASPLTFPSPGDCPFLRWLSLPSWLFRSFPHLTFPSQVTFPSLGDFPFPSQVTFPSLGDFPFPSPSDFPFPRDFPFPGDFSFLGDFPFPADFPFPFPGDFSFPIWLFLPR